MSPALDLGWGLLALALVPGVWLCVTSMFFGLGTLSKLMGIGHAGGLAVFEHLGSGTVAWLRVLRTRECASAVLSLVLLYVMLAGVQARPFSDEDFGRCVAGLDSAGQSELARIARQDMSREAFNSACAQARRANAPAPALPKTLAQLQADYATPAQEGAQTSISP